jgi:hypothetical protein
MALFVVQQETANLQDVFAHRRFAAAQTDRGPFLARSDAFADKMFDLSEAQALPTGGLSARSVAVRTLEVAVDRDFNLDLMEIHKIIQPQGPGSESESLLKNLVKDFPVKPMKTDE